MKTAVLRIAAGAALAAGKALVLAAPFRSLIRWVSNSSDATALELGSMECRRVMKISMALESMKDRMPWDSRCYDQALAAMLLLRLLGVPHTLYFGIRKNEVGELEAHAWVRAGRIAVSGGDECGRFSVIYFKSFQ